MSQGLLKIGNGQRLLQAVTCDLNQLVMLNFELNESK